MIWSARTFVITIALLLVLVTNAVPVDNAPPTGKELVSTTFTSTLATGMWLVEFFSPYCSHCKAFAPTWSMLIDMHGHLEDSSNFHFARVNCISQGDLCTENKIQGYPTIKLYADGILQMEYNEARSYEALSTFILTKAKEYKEKSIKP